MPTPINKVAAEKVTKASMFEVITGSKATEGIDMNISVDGTWQERGFSSLNGIVAAVSVTTAEYDTWKSSRDKKCQLNYVGPAPNMETTGAKNIFDKDLLAITVSVIQVTMAMVIANPLLRSRTINPCIKVKKYHCICHYQKRVGNRLRKLKTRVIGLGGKVKKTKGKGDRWCDSKI